MTRWRIELSVWPYSGMTRDADAKTIGDHERGIRGASEPHLFVDALGFREATRLALAIIQGIKLDERVWKVKIRGVHKEQCLSQSNAKETTS